MNGMEARQLPPVLEAWNRLFARSGEAAFIKDRAGVYLGATEAFARLAKLSKPEDAVGKRDDELFPDPDMAARWTAGDRELFARKAEEWPLTYFYSGERDEMVYIAGVKSPVLGEYGEVVAVRGACRVRRNALPAEDGAPDSAAQREARLTVALSRIDRFLHMEGRAGVHAFFLVELKGLSHVEAAFGRAGALDAANRVEETLRGLFRASDILARLSESEFALLMLGASSEANARRKGNELARAMQFVLSTSSQTVEITADVGATMCFGAHMDARDAYARARLDMESGAGLCTARDGAKASFLQLNTLLENLDGGVLVLRITDDVEMVYASPSFYKMSRRAPVDAGEFGEKLIGVIHPGDFPALRAKVFGARDSAAPFEHAFRVVEADGKSIGWRHMRAVYLSENGDGGGRQVVATITDISEMKRSENRFKLAEQRLRVAMEQTGAMIWEVDIRARTLYQSEEASRRMGHAGCVFPGAPESLITQGTIHPDSVSEFRAMFERLYAGVDGDDTSLLSKSDTGDWEWMNVSYRILRDEQGLPYRAIGAVVMRLNVEAEMRAFQNEIRFSDIMEGTLLGVVRANVSTNRCLNCTRSLSESAPYSYDELCQQLIDAAAPDERETLLAAIDRDALMDMYRRAQTWVICDYREILPDGAERWTNLTVNLIRHPISDNVYAFLYLRDIASAHRWEAALSDPVEKNSATLLYAPHTFAQMVRAAIAEAGEGALCAMAVADIGNLDALRRQSGAQAAQKALINAGRVCLGAIGDGAICGHLDETHFAVFRPNAQDVQTERLRLSRKRELVDQILTEVYVGEQLRISIGFAVSRAEQARFEELAERALVACRLADQWTGRAILEYNDLDMNTLRLAGQKRPGGMAGAPWRALVLDEDAAVRAGLRRALEPEFDVCEAENEPEARRMMRGGKLSLVALGLLSPSSEGWKALAAMRADADMAQLPAMGIIGQKSADGEMRALNMGASDVVSYPYSEKTFLSRARNIAARYDALKIADMNRAYEQRFQQQANQLLLAQYDELTGLYNRQGFFTHVRKRLDADPDGRYMVLLWDIDNFKTLNDALGARECDRLLKDFAFEMQAQRSETETIAHVEADHFLCFMPADEERVSHFCEQLGAWLSAYPFNIKLSGRAGVYSIDDAKMDISVMCDRALLAARSIKGSYTTRVAYYDKSLRDQLMEEQQLVSEMAVALESGQFAVYFQPQYDYVSRRIIGAEALVRWMHPQLGMIPPGKFISLFERNGFISLLDAYVWEKSCQYLRKWMDEEGIEPIAVSVNLSRIDIYNARLCENLLALIGKYGLSPKSLKLEVTESAYIDNPQHLIEVVSRLQRMGFTIEMDDFGSGYSSLNTLKDVPVDILKLDTKFLGRGLDDSRGGNILSSVIRMARWLNLPIIAEGVETKEQAEFLKGLGCSYMQGYYFARPMPAEEFEAVLRSGERGGKAEKTAARMDDMNAFWNPSAQTLRFFSAYIGGAVILEYRLGNAEVILANDRFFQELRASREECQGMLKCLQTFFGDEDRAKFLGMLDRASESGREEACELKHTPPSAAETVWTYNRARMLAVNEQSRVLFVSVENITDRKALEARRALNRARQLVRSFYGEVWGVDFAANTAEAYAPGEEAITTARDAVSRLSERCADEAARARFLAWMTNADAEEVSFFEFPLPGARVSRAARVNLGEGRALLCFDGDACALPAPRPKAGGKAAGAKHGDEGVDARVARIVARHAGYAILRYEAGEGRARVEYAADSAMPGRWIEGVPEKWIETGVVLPESANAVRALFSQIEAGAESGEARLHLKLNSDDASQWYEARFTSLPAAGGARDVSVITLSNVTREHENALAYERYLQTAGALDRGMYFEADLTDNRVDNGGGELLGRAFSEHRSEYDDAASNICRLFFTQKDQPRAQKFFRRERFIGLIDGNVPAVEADFECAGNDGPRMVRAYAHLFTDALTGHKNAFLLLRETGDAGQGALEFRIHAERDGMTGLYNRTACERLIREALSKNSGVPCALLVLDLDNLKAINDALGHSYGDRAITIAASQMMGQFRKTDIVGRMGGDEFAAFLIGVEPGDALRKTIRGLLHRIELMRVGDSGQIPVRGSIGVAFGKTGADEFGALYEQADTALYAVKRSGKGGYAFYTPDMQRLSAVEPLDWAVEEADALGLAGVKKLLRAMTGFFPSACSINLTRNSYVYLDDANKRGAYDDMVETIIRGARPGERVRLRQAISRQSLMDGYACGKYGARLEARMEDSLGARSLARIEIALASDGSGGDVCGIFSINIGEMPKE